ncbi:MAG: SdpI family protein [Anaerolineales bacterium]|nr:SdpI family protein [Anaerolineales bacterium]MCX7609632.1 SdpI family protein [Anaerolineales bacterium]MDW8227223.1 SdpI family protein [Anaerolineales bacterium]
MSNKFTLFLSLTLIFGATAVGVLLYGQLPDPMPSHWNAAGEVDGYISRFWGVFLIPLVTLGLLVLFLLIPTIDPLKANIAQFRPIYNAFIVGFIVYMLYVYGLTLAAALGSRFNMTQMLLPAIGLLFLGISFLIKNAKRNFFIGIRTPWTLSSDRVWEKTHQLGAKLFALSGLITLVSAFLGETGLWLMLAALLLAVVVPIVYSYLLFAQEEQTK